MKAIIVDDERLARKELQYLLTTFEKVELIGSYENVDTAVESFKRERPDLIFLDINMPERNGFDLVEEIEDETIQIVFVTAYDQFAIKAFEHNALDYLLKPITSKRLAIAIERAGKTMSLQGRRSDEHLLSKSLKVKNGEQILDINIEEVALFESYGNYVKLHWNSKVVLHHISLNVLESQVDSRRFFRANRYTLVPLKKIAKVVKHSRSKIAFEMINGSKVICSERKTIAYRKFNSL